MHNQEDNSQSLLSTIAQQSLHPVDRLPPDIRNILTDICDRQAQKIVAEMPKATAEQITQYKLDLFANLAMAVGQMLSNRVAHHMRSEEFELGMLEVLKTGNFAAVYSDQLGLIGELINQNLKLFFVNHASEIERLQAKIQKLEKAHKEEHNQDLERKWERIRLSRLRALEWAIAFSQWWRLLAAAIAGAIIAGPIFINWPEKVLCDRGDWLCLQLRVREGKYVRK
jgi:hypothetical protein